MVVHVYAIGNRSMQQQITVTTNQHLLLKVVGFNMGFSLEIFGFICHMGKTLKEVHDYYHAWLRVQAEDMGEANTTTLFTDLDPTSKRVNINEDGGDERIEETSWTLEEANEFLSLLNSLPESPERLQMIAEHMGETLKDVHDYYQAWLKVQSEEDVEQRKLDDEKRLDLACCQRNPEKMNIIYFLLQIPVSEVKYYYERLQKESVLPGSIIGNEIVIAPQVMKLGEWSEDENMLLLEGIEKCKRKDGRMDWVGIATRFVKTRTRTRRQIKDRARCYPEKLKNAGSLGQPPKH